MLACKDVLAVCFEQNVGHREQAVLVGLELKPLVLLLVNQTLLGSAAPVLSTRWYYGCTMLINEVVFEAVIEEFQIRLEHFEDVEYV